MLRSVTQMRARREGDADRKRLGRADLQECLEEVAGLPRLLDMGQCNDAYGAVQVALGLAKAFDCGVNELPLTLVISWFEQNAVAVLFTLLHLGVKGIRIGPAAPAFVSPNVFELLRESFDMKLVESEPPREVFDFAAT
ncbi:MAG: hypothetical protein QF681_17440 [Vicinamibacterales bacterium]|jgi:hydroxylamine reductase|nr:hypothetical protein [Vicinamibacterales bacterium]